MVNKKKAAGIKKFNKQTGTDKAIIICLITIISLLPILIRGKIIKFAGPVIGEEIISPGIMTNIFTSYKFIFLILMTIITLLFFLYKTAFKKFELRKQNINIPLLILFLFITVSGFFADYYSISLIGMYDRHEGTLTYLCYIALFFIAANITLNINYFKLFIYALFPITIVNAFLSIYAFWDYEILKIPFVKHLIVPSYFTFSSAKITMTLSNPNYLSGISAALLVTFLTIAMFNKDKKAIIINIVMASLSFTMLLSSLSTSGFFTVIVMVPILLFYLVKSDYPKNAAITILISVCCFIVLFNVMNSQNPKVWRESIGFFIGNQSSTNIENVDATKKDTLLHEIAKDFDLPEPGISAGNGRTYIWSKTIELIKERPVTGYGLDTIVYYFPNHDPQFLANMGNTTTLVNKPHNMYLNIAYGSGVIALLAFLALVILVIVKSIQLLYTGINNIEKIYLAGFLSFCIAYLIQGLFNDSIIGTAPIFWILLGIVSSINYKLSTAQ